MAKKPVTKITPAVKAAPVAAKSVVDSSIKATVARNSPLPKAEPRSITHDMIAKRAYEIYVSGKGGSQDENWSRAERDLRGS